MDETHYRVQYPGVCHELAFLCSCMGHGDITWFIQQTMLLLIVLVVFMYLSAAGTFEAFDMPRSFVITGQYRDLCLDSETNAEPARYSGYHRPARWWKCDARSKNQRLTYDAKKKVIKNTAGQCLDDGGAIKAGAQPLRFETCDNSANQTWQFDAKAVLWRNPSKNMCLHDGNGQTAGMTSPTIWPCDTFSRAQRYYPKSTTACF